MSDIPEGKFQIFLFDRIDADNIYIVKSGKFMMRQTTSLILMIFSVVLSIIIVSTGISIQEQGLTTASYQPDLSIKNITVSGNQQYLIFPVDFINNGYIPVSLKIGNKTEYLSGLSSVSTEVYVKVNVTELVKHGWLTGNVSLNVSALERAFYYNFAENYKVNVGRIFDSYGMFEKNSDLIITFIPSESLIGSVVSFHYNGITKDENIEGNDTYTLSFQDPSSEEPVVMNVYGLSLNLDM